MSLSGSRYLTGWPTVPRFYASRHAARTMRNDPRVTNGDGTWNVYLSGEIHSDWRQRIAEGVRGAGLPVELLAPVTDHSASDDVGANILGEEGEQFWRDHKGAAVNAGYAAALGKPILTLHDAELTHALKEVDRAAMAVAESPEQVVEILRY